MTLQSTLSLHNITITLLASNKILDVCNIQIAVAII